VCLLPRHRKRCHRRETRTMTAKDLPINDRLSFDKSCRRGADCYGHNPSRGLNSSESRVNVSSDSCRGQKGSLAKVKEANRLLEQGRSGIRRVSNRCQKGDGPDSALSSPTARHSGEGTANTNLTFLLCILQPRYVLRPCTSDGDRS
jgi:hypothetical protein